MITEQQSDRVCAERTLYCAYGKKSGGICIKADQKKIFRHYVLYRRK